MIDEKDKAHRSDSNPSLRETLLLTRYLRKDCESQIVETESDMYRRVAGAIAAVERQYGAAEKDIHDHAATFYRMLSLRQFLPNSPTLMNAGRDTGVLSACYVIPIEDSIESIFEAVKNTAVIQKSGGGTGFSFDQLRPTGDLVESSGGSTSGPISFMKVLSETSHAIQQGALRRGANMAVISINHPDVLKFIVVKQEPSALTNFNISIKISDDFMKRLRDHPTEPHIVVNPRTKRQYMFPTNTDLQNYQLADLLELGDENPPKCLSVHDVWDRIVKNAHASGEPGLIFIDHINENNPTPHVGRMGAMNPCGEQPLLDYECCNLGSLNISAFVCDDRSGVDWESMNIAVRNAIRFLDNVIDANHWPLEEIKVMALGNRKIGLGVMGVADALILLGIRYDSDEAVDFCRKVSRSIQEQAHAASHILADERGSFPNWQGSVWDNQRHHAMRNATCTTVAPTGSISLLAECSNGIEPVFHWVIRRRAIDGQDFVQVHPMLERLGTEEGWLNQRTKGMLAEGCPTQGIAEIPAKLADVLVTAHEVSPEWHVKIQSAFQQHVDNAVSKTVNLPSQATVSEVDHVFQLAYDWGCKGVTVYRDGSRKGQVVSFHNRQGRISQSSPNRLRPRDSVTSGQTSKFRMGCGTLFVTVNRDEQGICEVFANLGKAGGCPSQSEATCRVVSAALRSGIAPRILVDQLSNIRCLSASVARKRDSGVNVLSCPDAIAKALGAALGDSDTPVIETCGTCPECGSRVRKESGCILCDQCGFSKCG